jgi:VanZ family protein
MPNFDNLQASVIERRLLRWLLLFYCLFIIYGSFIPFRFNLDPEFIKYRLSRFLAYDHVLRRFSIPDAFSNIVLFVPFGFLWVGGMLSEQWSRRLWRVVPALGVLGLAFGLVIESAQMLFPNRIASLLDAVCNGLGSAMGAAAACLLFRALYGKLGSIFLQLLRERPSVILLALLLLAAVGDAYYPFDVTLDVSTVWNNFKRIHWVPFAGGHRYWLDLFVDKTLVFAAIAYLGLRSLPQARCSNSRVVAGIACSAFVLLVEGAKLFFVGPVPNAENAIFSAAGALCGVLFIPRLATTALARRHGRQVLMVLLLSVIAYSELSPFDWIQSPDQIPMRISKIEWLPFASYYYAEPQSVLFDLAKKIFLWTPLGLLIAAGHHNRSSKRTHGLTAAAAGLILGSVFEVAQLGLGSRTPSITDILLFSVTAWAGAVIFERYWQISASSASAASNQRPTFQALTCVQVDTRRDHQL